MEFSVAPDGDDAGPGTSDHPFSSLGRAQAAVREAVTAGAVDVTVTLRGGIFGLEAPLRFSAADSGTRRSPVVWQAEAGEEAVISGGQPLTGWARDEARPELWRVDVANLDTRQLYVDGRRCWRARLGGGHAGGLPGTVRQTEYGYVTSSPDPLSWGDPAGIELVYRGHGGFAEPRCGVAEIRAESDSTTAVVMDQPGFRRFDRNHRGRWGSGPRGFGEEMVFEPPLPLWVENSLSFLTDGGSFCIDKSAAGQHILFYLPRVGEEPEDASVVAPRLEQLVVAEGAHDIVFRGITFAHATWLGPDQPTGFSQVFGPIYEGGDTPDAEDPWDSSESARSVPGNVALRGCERIRVEACRFTMLGGDALELSLGCHRCVVSACRFEDVSGGGIQLGSRQPDTDTDARNEENRIEDNRVREIGREYQGSIGIYAEKTQRTTIAHNEVSDVPYTAISFGEYWTHYPEGETTASGNRILNNHVFDTTKSLSDGGGIFTASHQGTSYEDGAVVSGNLVHRIRARSSAGIADAGGLQPEDIGEEAAVALYADDDSNWVTWRENVVYAVEGTTISGCPLNNRFQSNFLEDTPEPRFWCVRGGPLVDFVDNVSLDGSADEEARVASSPAAARIAERAGPRR